MAEDPRDVAELAATLMGGEVSDEPAPEGSALAKLQALDEARQRGDLTEEEAMAAVERVVMAERRAQARED